MTASELIKQFEGCRLTAYPDPATGGAPWTIGYGCTGPGIGPGLVWTQAQADAALEHRLAALTELVREACPSATDNQTAAMCSLAWNIGTHAFLGSQVEKRLRAGDVDGAADAFLNWTHAAGKVLPGLVTRRQAEREVFLTP